MENIPRLSFVQQQQVLAYLGLAAAPPTLAFLEQLVAAYASHVPWETASRIARKANTPLWRECPRFAELFWQEAVTQGTGGTCFESNYAFFALLRSLGYEGYLTVNNMGEQIGCHTAIVLLLDGQKWLADVGIPLYVPLPLDAAAITTRHTPFHQYTVIPLGPNLYQIERTHHPKPVIFTLIDTPVPDAAYREALTQDYGPDGLFLNRIVVTKLIRGSAWLYNPQEFPDRLISFREGERQETPLNAPIAASLAHHFALDEQVIHQALEQLSGNH